MAGTTGAGKTTTAGRIGRALGIPHTEIDSLFHGPDWEPRPTFEADVEAYTAEPEWVTEWQYQQVRTMLTERADTLVWLDLPIPIVFWRLVRRTVRRRLRRTELWNGNVEPPLWTFFTNRDHIIRWGIRGRRGSRRMVPAAEQAAPHLRVVRLRSQSDVDAWVDRLPRPSE
ncbi:MULTISPECIES: AAA family ATPase [unclassified Curtobacterium]|uniref:AAA family ATPase n=1 Tax=unclassified Curtobacterium TaxID=257496 RepID=UPI0038122291